MKLVALALALTLTCQPAAAQKCGQGTYVCRVTKPNGELVKHLRYELYGLGPALTNPANLRLLSDTLNTWRQFYSLFYQGALVSSQTVQQLQQAGLLQAGDEQFGIKNSSDQVLSTMPYTGAVRHGQLVFHTYELAVKLCLLKLTADETTVYLLCNPFGGCDGTSTILWTGNQSSTVLQRRTY